MVSTWIKLSMTIIKLLKILQIVLLHHITIIIINFTAGSRTMSTDDPSTTPSAIESNDATTAMATTIEPHATTIVSRETAPASDNEVTSQSNIGLLVGVTVPSASFVVLVAIFIVVVGVLLRVIKKGQGSKTSGSGPQVQFHDEGKGTSVIILLDTLGQLHVLFA